MSMIEGNPSMEVLRRILAGLDEGQIPECVDKVPPPDPSHTPEQAFRHFEQIATNLVAQYAAMLGEYRWARQKEGAELTLPMSKRDLAVALARCVGGDHPDVSLMPSCKEIADRICKLVPTGGFLTRKGLD